MKKYLLFILLLLLFPTVVSASEHNYLYDVLKREAQTGTYAKEYTGEHNDTIGGGDKKIYHWYSETAANNAAIQNKWNVVFGGKCWEAFRTTDGGGTKLLYNGIASNNKCLDSREMTGEYYYYDAYSNLPTDQNIKYGTEYYFNEEDNLFYIKGTISNYSADINEEYNCDVCNKYTCLNTNSEEGCETIKLITYKDVINNRYHSLEIHYGSRGITSDYYKANYSIGYARYAYNRDYMNTVGYMYDKDIQTDLYSFSTGNYTVPQVALTQEEYEIVKNDSNVSFVNNSDTWKATQVNSAVSEISFKFSNPGDYVINYSVVRQGNTVISINDNEVKRFESYSNYSDKYVLNDIESNDVIKIKFDSYYGNTSLSISFGKVNGEITDNRTLFGSSVEYKNGKYKLLDTMGFSGNDSIVGHRYTCLNKTGECEELYFGLYYYGTYYLTAIKLTGGQDLDKIFGEILYKEDINKNDSLIKRIIDSWFEKNMLDYQDYLEPTVFCNNRYIYNKDHHFLSMNGINNQLSFYGSDYSANDYDAEDRYNNNIYCTYETDRFSVNNPKAKLKYSVALPTVYELNILNNKNVNSVAYKNGNILTMSPYGLAPTSLISVKYSSASSSTTHNNQMVRPVISLKGNVEYESGTGTKEDPYIISNLMYSNIIKENDDNKGTLTINGDIEDIRNNTEVTFTLENKKGFNVKSVKVLDDTNNEIEITVTGNTYKFNMPTSDVRIITEYTAVLNILNTLKNMNTALIAIILVIIGYGAYILIKKRK